MTPTEGSTTDFNPEMTETVIAVQSTPRFGGEIRLVKIAFWVYFRSGGGIGPFNRERQTSWRVFGDGLSSLDTTEQEARSRFARSCARLA